MRYSHLAALVLLTLTVSGAVVVGCRASADDCEVTLKCGTGTGAGTTTSSSSGGGGSAGDPCVPSEHAGPISEDCGIFVDIGGDDLDPGTQSAPVKSLVKAMQLAKSGAGRVYACGQVFKEAVEVPPGISIFGALDCQSDWSYNAGKRTSIETDPGVIPLKLSKGGNGIRLEDLNARAADAVAPGGSSIAVIADGATATITRCDFTAGAGVAGDKGGTPTDDVGSLDNPDAPEVKGGDGVNACMATNSGGIGKTNPLCMESIGGNGGDGGAMAASGAPGTDGVPSGDASIGKGGGVDVNGVCSPGGYGQDGAVGAPGAGAADVGLISATGYAGVAGAPGMKGLPGQGGGGGGGGKGKVGCNGASGGGGGAGGCGGGGGLGGLPGGASIALISLDAALTFTDVKLKAGNGGPGGAGGDGQLGGIGGSGGKGGLLVAGTTKGCSGGDGGSGGIGGQGGGGRGGHSLGVAFTGKSPPKASITIGMAGVGGTGLDVAGAGAPGEAANTLEFPAGI